MAAEISQSLKTALAAKNRTTKSKKGLFGNDKKAEDQRTSGALLANHQSIAKTPPVLRQPSCLKNIACTPLVLVDK